MKTAIYCGKDNFSKISLQEQNKAIKTFMIENDLSNGEVDLYVDDENSCDQLFKMLTNIYAGKYTKLVCYDHKCISSFEMDINDVKNAIVATNTDFYEITTGKNILKNDGFCGSKFLFLQNGLKTISSNKKKKLKSVLWTIAKFIISIVYVLAEIIFTILKLFISLVLLAV